MGVAATTVSSRSVTQHERPLDDLIKTLCGPAGQWSMHEDYYYWEVNGEVQHVYMLTKDSSDRFHYHYWHRLGDLLDLFSPDTEIDLVLSWPRHEVTDGVILLELDVIAMNDFPREKINRTATNATRV